MRDNVGGELLAASRSLTEMDLRDHFDVTSTALKNWAVAQFQDSLAVGLLWLVGLRILKVPRAPYWSLLAAVLQFVPHFGPGMGKICPVLAAPVRRADSQHPLHGP